MIVLNIWENKKCSKPPTRWDIENTKVTKVAKSHSTSWVMFRQKTSATFWAVSVLQKSFKIKLLVSPTSLGSLVPLVLDIPTTTSNYGDPNELWILHGSDSGHPEGKTGPLWTTLELSGTVVFSTCFLDLVQFIEVGFRMFQAISWFMFRRWLHWFFLHHRSHGPTFRRLSQCPPWHEHPGVLTWRWSFCIRDKTQKWLHI